MHPGDAKDSDPCRPKIRISAVGSTRRRFGARGLTQRVRDQLTGITVGLRFRMVPTETGCLSRRQPIGYRGVSVTESYASGLGITDARIQNTWAACLVSRQIGNSIYPPESIPRLTQGRPLRTALKNCPRRFHYCARPAARRGRAPSGSGVEARLVYESPDR